MKIIVNEMPIDFELEGETTAGSIVHGVTNWLTTNSHVVETVEINGTIREDRDETWRELPLEETEEIRIVARSLYQQQIEGLETLITYTGLLRRVMAEGNDEQVRAVLEELPFVLEGVQRITPDLAGLLEEPLQGNSGDVPPVDIRKKLAARAQEMAKLFENRQREMVDPEHEMALTLALLGDILPRFEEIPGELQSGEGRKAMDTITRFTEVAIRMLRIMPRVVEARPALQDERIEGLSLNDLIPAIRDLLAELEEAFRNTDYVLLGDLLEYEVLPRFSALSETVSRHIAAPR
ncbi:MAG: hypothetical protein EA427_09350 [Spirochaetaceae bacterium]|nr:MAG: hypothetical protein EA427_09350 [Spirochaetaceae bacterium]